MWNVRALSLASFAALLMTAISTPAVAEYATSSTPLVFGPDQTIIDLNKANTEVVLVGGFTVARELRRRVVEHRDARAGGGDPAGPNANESVFPEPT